jgi:soluble lytic murein transglycosylase-like protein
MPSTAFELQPGLDYLDLFDRDTNLRLGFRYLRRLMVHYGGDLRTALLAYNRGPTRVDEIRRRGVDPGNGYARAIMERAGTQ